MPLPRLLHHPARAPSLPLPSPPVAKQPLSAGVYKTLELLIHEGQGCAHFVSVAPPLSSSFSFFFSPPPPPSPSFCIIYFPYWGWSDPLLVMRAGVTVCLESRGRRRAAALGPHGSLLLARRRRGPSAARDDGADCKSGALLTHVHASPPPPPPPPHHHPLRLLHLSATFAAGRTENTPHPTPATPARIERSFEKKAVAERKKKRSQ